MTLRPQIQCKELQEIHAFDMGPKDSPTVDWVIGCAMNTLTTDE